MLNINSLLNNILKKNCCAGGVSTSLFNTKAQTQYNYFETNYLLIFYTGMYCYE